MFELPEGPPEVGSVLEADRTHRIPDGLGRVAQQLFGLRDPLLAREGAKRLPAVFRNCRQK
jgi:hypothetical protein